MYRLTIPAMVLAAALIVSAPRAGERPATWEDIYGPGGDSFQAQLSFLVFEGDTDLGEASDGHGLAVDDLLIEWAEKHPVDAAGAACDFTPSGDGHCATVTLERFTLYEGNALVDVTVFDFNARASGQAVCQGSICTVDIRVTTEAERDGETITLDGIDPGGGGEPGVYTGVIPVSSTISVPGDGIAAIRQNGIDLPSVTVRYVDEDDGVRDASVFLGTTTPDLDLDASGVTGPATTTWREGFGYAGDAAAPPTGSAFSYLVRGHSAWAGEGSLGTDSSGIGRAGITCP